MTQRTELSAPQSRALLEALRDTVNTDAEARKEAIADAKAKAESLAASLGVRLVRIVGFSEGSSGPIYYAKEVRLMTADSAEAPSPEIPVGENKITSNISLTYEIQ